MVGGGIYIALGVVVSLSGKWASLSFLIAGIAAAITAYSYAKLSNKYQSSGGAFKFLEEMQHESLAGSLSWLLIIGYTLTIALYIFAFGHYVAFAFDGGDMLTRILAIGVGIGLTGLNLLGLGKMTAVEVVIVSANLTILLILGVFGLTRWDSLELSTGLEPKTPAYALIGAAVIFVSYEGFQLLTYEYEKIKNASKSFVPILVSAAIFVVTTYIVVALGATMLAGALKAVEQKQVALTIAAQNAWGITGLVILTIAAGFATAAAINSTLFSTGELTFKIARDKELPGWFEHRNAKDVPSRGIVLIGLLATLLAVTGGLSSIVEAASLIFLITFGVVNWLALKNTHTIKWLQWVALVIIGIIGIVLVVRLALVNPIPLLVLLIMSILVLLARPFLLDRYR
ncbi:hypothetical protein GCM10027098_14610 [Bowmanella dokdonensis]